LQSLKKACIFKKGFILGVFMQKYSFLVLFVFFTFNVCNYISLEEKSIQNWLAFQAGYLSGLKHLNSQHASEKENIRYVQGFVVAKKLAWLHSSSSENVQESLKPYMTLKKPDDFDRWSCNAASWRSEEGMFNDFCMSGARAIFTKQKAWMDDN
jgi:hypothetical protein